MKILITEQDKQINDIHYIFQGLAFSKQHKTKESTAVNTITKRFFIFENREREKQDIQDEKPLLPPHFSGLIIRPFEELRGGEGKKKGFEKARSVSLVRRKRTDGRYK